MGGGCLGVTGGESEEAHPAPRRVQVLAPAADLVTASSLPQLASLPLAVGGTLAPPARWAGGTAVEDSWLGRLPRMDGASTPVLSFAPPIVGGFAAPADSPRGTAQLAIDAFGPLRPRPTASLPDERVISSLPEIEALRGALDSDGQIPSPFGTQPLVGGRLADAGAPVESSFGAVPASTAFVRTALAARPFAVAVPRAFVAPAQTDWHPPPAVDLSPWEHSPPSLASFFMPAAEQAGRATLLPAAPMDAPMTVAPTFLLASLRAAEAPTLTAAPLLLTSPQLLPAAQPTARAPELLPAASLPPASSLLAAAVGDVAPAGWWVPGTAAAPPGTGLFPAVDYDEAWLARLARTGGSSAPLLSFASLGVSFALVPPRATDGPRGPAQLELDALEPLRSVALSVALSVASVLPDTLNAPLPGVGFVDGAPATPEVPSTWPPLTPVVGIGPAPTRHKPLPAQGAAAALSLGHAHAPSRDEAAAVPSAELTLGPSDAGPTPTDELPAYLQHAPDIASPRSDRFVLGTSLPEVTSFAELVDLGAIGASSAPATSVAARLAGLLRLTSLPSALLRPARLAPSPPALPAAPAVPPQCYSGDALTAAVPARPRLSAASPGFNVLRPETALDAGWGEFGFVRDAPPGSEGRVEAHLGGGGVYGAPAMYETARPRAAAVRAVLRTSPLCRDRNDLRVAYQLRGASGASQVDRTGLVLTLLIRVNETSAAREYRCAEPATSGGVGECTAALPPEDFGSVARRVLVRVAAAYDGVRVAVSPPLPLDLVPVAPVGALGEAGMLLALPPSPRFVGEEFDAVLHAHTGPPNFLLTGWGFHLAYDATVIQLVGEPTFSDLYQSPGFTHDEAAGTLDAVATGLRAAATRDDVRSQRALRLATLRFRVLRRCGGGSCEVLSAVATSMVNQITLEYVSNATAWASDHRGALRPRGALVIEKTREIGVLAYAEQAALVNTAALNGGAVAVTIRALSLYNRAAQRSAPAPPYTCNVTELAVGSAVHPNSGGEAPSATAASSCSVVLDQHATRGGALEVGVASRESSAGALVHIHVWYPVSVSVRIADTRLQRVGGVAAAARRCHHPPGAYQATDVSAAASFGGDGLETVSDLEVTALVSFMTGNETVARMRGATLLGLHPGATWVAASVAAAGRIALADAAVTVHDEVVSVARLSAVVVTGVVWTVPPPPVVPWAPATSTFTSQARFDQSLSAEGATGDVIAIAALSDGHERPLSADELAVVSRSPSLVAIAPGPGGNWGVRVEAGATSECGPLVEVAWLVCNATLAVGEALASVQLPRAIAIRVLPFGWLTTPEDPAAQQPMSVPHAAPLRIVVDFSDGTSLDLSADPRLTLSVDDTSCAAIESGELRVKRGATCVEVTVLAVLPSLAPGLVGSRTARLVRLDAVELAFLPHPSFPGHHAVDAMALRRVACTGVFQRAQALVRARLSNGSLTTITSYAALTSLTPAVSVEREESPRADGAAAAPWIVSATAAANATLSATFHSRIGTRFLSVLDEGVGVDAVNYKLAGAAAANRFSFVALAGSARRSKVEVRFADGTAFADIADADWIAPGALVQFSTTDPAAIDINSSSGVATLLGNAPTRVTLSAGSVCADRLSGSANVAANLQPGLADVDLGNEIGLQFEQEQEGAALRVPARANVGGDRLVTYQLRVEFDRQIFEASACAGGDLAGFTCTINDPVHEALLIATDPASVRRGGGVLLGSLTLRVAGSGVTLLTGFVVELVRKNGRDQTIRAAEALIAAGTGFADVRATAARRRRLRPSGPPLRSRELQESRCELVDGCLAGLWGDVSGDCRFTSYDVLFAQEVFLGQMKLESLCAWSRQQLDPTQDGHFARVTDAIYLQLVVARKYRFLANVSVDDSRVVQGTNGPLLVTVLLYDEASEPATRRTSVRMELGYRGAPPLYALGEADTAEEEGLSRGGVSPAGNWLARASDATGRAGAYGVAVAPDGGWEPQEDPVGIAIMVETVDALGNADEERKFAFFGSSASPFGELTPVGMEPFRPFRFFSVQSAGSSPPPPFRPPTELTPTSFTSAVVLSLAVSLLAPAASLVTPSVSLDASPPPAAAELPPALLPPAPPWGLSPTAAPPPTPQGGLPPLPDASQSPGMADAPLPLPPLPPAPLDRPWSTPPFQLPPCPPVVQGAMPPLRAGDGEAPTSPLPPQSARPPPPLPPEPAAHPTSPPPASGIDPQPCDVSDASHLVGAALPCVHVGCLVPTADNYNPSATRHNRSSCVHSVAPPPSANASYGCTHALAMNWDSLSTADDGTCVFERVGCTDSTAVNFESQLTRGDAARCVWAIPGCMFAKALNYDSTSTIDDGASCIFERRGCMDSTSANFDSRANAAGSCVGSKELGCMNPAAVNFDSRATLHDASCIYKRRGCLNSTASNYDPLAEVDAPCVHGVQKRGCLWPGATNYDSTATTSADNCEIALRGCMDSHALNYVSLATLPPQSGAAECVPRRPGCLAPHALNYDSSATTQDSALCRFARRGCLDSTNPAYRSSANQEDASLCVMPQTRGCMDPAATTYDSAATVHATLDCKYPRAGCTSPAAPNFEAWADLDDGSCAPLRYGCTSPAALNFDSRASVVDSSCRFPVLACLDSLAANYASELEPGPRVVSAPDSCVYAGCTDSRASNYDRSASILDLSCVFSAPGCPEGTCLGCTDSQARAARAALCSIPTPRLRLRSSHRRAVAAGSQFRHERLTGRRKLHSPAARMHGLFGCQLSCRR